MQKELRTQINNLELSIKSASADASRKSDITTIAVSKKNTIEHIKCAYDLGIRNFGENYAQELEEKARQLKLDKIIWHFIGPLQSNKTKIISNYAHWVHSLDREKIVNKI
jgi:uncharacterized pyridoxal phosphate-containing UPF0001 family protein